MIRIPKVLGGFSAGVPPLPIPNREVKPCCADGTGFSGRVGRRRFFFFLQLSLVKQSALQGFFIL
jgi:hypothetical protein